MENSSATKPTITRPRHYKVIAAVDPTERSTEQDYRRAFTSCPFQKVCWNTVRKPIIRANKGLYLPYICSYQVEGDLEKCSHHDRFTKEQESV